MGASSANPTNLVLAGGTLTYSGPSATIDRGYKLQSNYSSNGVPLNAAIDVQGDLTLTGAATAAVDSGFVKAGPAMLTYAGAVTNELAGGGFPGYNLENGTVFFDGSSGAQTNHLPNELWVGASTNTAAALVLSNATLTVDSWLAIGRGNGTGGLTSTATLYNSRLTSGSASLGFWGGITNYLAHQALTLNGNSTFRDNGDFNVGESAGSSSTVTINDNSSISTPNRILFGMETGATGALMIANSGTLTNGGWVSIANRGVATATIKDNAVWQALVDFNVTDLAGTAESPSYGTLNIQDNAKLIISTLYIGKGAYCYATVNQSGGSVLRNGGGDWRVGGNVSGGQDQFGTYNLSGGTLDVGAANFQIGAYGTGECNQSGGTAVSSGGHPSVGRFAGGVGTYNLFGGTFYQLGTGQGFIVGENGTGTLNVSGTGQLSITNFLGLGWTGTGSGTLNLTNGSVTVYKNVILGNAANGAATVNLYGGTLAAQQFTANAGASSAMNFDGGTLLAMPGANANFLSGLSAAVVYSGGALINSGTNAITIAQDLLDGGGGLTKLGTGTLTLDGMNSYSGPTTVSAGTLGGNGTIASPVTVQAGATLAPGASLGALTINNTLNLLGATVMEVNKTTGANDQVLGVTTLTYGGTLVLKNLAGLLVPGDTFTLFTAATYAGSFASVVSETPGQVVTWDTTKLAMDGTVKVLTAAALPVRLTSFVSGGQLTLSWPLSQIGWELQTQVNPLTVGLSTNWSAVTGSTATNQMSFPINPASGSTFFRLLFP